MTAECYPSGLTSGDHPTNQIPRNEMYLDALTSGTFHRPGDDLGGEPNFSLQTLVEVGRAFRGTDGLPDGFGEGLLLNEFAPYRRQRRWLLGMGYRFVELHDRPAEDHVAPELQLLAILRERRFPYTSLGPAVEGLLKMSPRATFDDAGFMQATRGNNCSHEGSHGVIYELARERAGTKSFSGEAVTEALLVGEGFAIAFDLLLTFMLLSHERRSAPLLFSLNVVQSSLGLRELERAQPGILRRLAAFAQDEPTGMLKLLTAASLVANVRPVARALGAPFVQYLVDFSGLDSRYAEEAKVLIDASLSLGIDFRRDLARTFFRFNDLEGAYHAVCQRPLEYHFEAGSLFHDVLPSATAVALVD